MKKFVPLVSLLGLVACQTTTDLSKQEPADNTLIMVDADEIETATPAEITEALLADETADVFHPVDDVDIQLTDDNQIDVSSDIWLQLQQSFTFEVPENDRVIAQRRWYAKNQNYLDRVAKRAEPFLHYIVTELVKHEVPLEIALLPIVESAFDPFAYSHGRASGMWQFVPDTGKRFGMKQTWWYDGRRDVIASTQGAIDYLKYLNNMFDGDWLLALAAYNSGEGRVLRAMKTNARKGKPTDFWSLDLPKETSAYVPKLLALVDLVKRPIDFGLKFYEIDNQPVITTVSVKHQIDLAKAAELAELSLGEFQRLNPGFNRWATDPDGPDYLVLPLAKADEFEQKLANLSADELLSWKRYKIRNGDSLSVIAAKFDTSVELVREVNNLQNNQIRAGQFLLIPVAAKSLNQYIMSANQRLAKKQNQTRQGEKTVYQVKSGDTLWDIARAYKVSHRSVAKWNGMAPTDPIKPGQELVIWQKQPTVSTNPPAANAVIRNITYRVRSGDSLARIAQKFHVSIADIERWNKLSRKNYLQPGQMLKLSVDVTNIKS